MAPKAQSGNIIFVDPEIAKLEGVDIDRLVAHYATKNIRLITRHPEYLEEEDRWQCFGCMAAWERDAETWRPCTLPGGPDWQPLCRRCEGTELSQDRELTAARIRERKKNEGRERKKPGKQAWNHDQPAGAGRPARPRPAGAGRPPRGRQSR